MKKRTSAVDIDIRKRIERDPEFAEAYFEELLDKPVAIQAALLRRLYGVSQVKLAERLHVKQAYISKLEQVGSDHLVGAYEKIAKALNGRFGFLPPGAKIVLPKGRITQAAA